MNHTVKLTYELSWTEAEEILQNLLDNKTVEVFPSSDDPRLMIATSSEQELDAGEIDERMSQYFGTKCICWGTHDSVLVVTDQPLYALTHVWDDDSGSGSNVIAISASKSVLSDMLLENSITFQTDNAGTEWDPDLTEIPSLDEETPLCASFGWKGACGSCDNVHRWSIDEVQVV